MIEARVDDYRYDNFINRIRLVDKEGHAVLDKTLRDQGGFVTQYLRKDEAIIGVYGVKGKKSWFTSLGFIVWDTSAFR